ncbi:hypothetical protein FSP39_007787 [Pinctada imbricata]|uniref:Uncharacterized protein n=1 Tax=Pinctada imbricata TaxID=66713 RepID=A0AA88YUU9_PINIB|nr:hypothetical protein FSP39_007787 [Pinctada imbricata]
MTLKAFADADQKSGKPDAVVLSTVNEFEKKLCESHTRIEIKGKRGRKVAVLLTKEMKESIEVLISQRKKANVSKDLLFSKPGEAIFPYRGSDCLRKFAVEAEVQNPSAITSTKLRKQLATLAQILNLSETSQDIFATFLGHNIRVHREFYRLSEDAMQVAKVSKVLHSINNGSISKYSGKDFDDIKLAEKEVLESESMGSSEEETKGSDGSESEEIAKESPVKTPVKKCKKHRSMPKARHTWTQDEKAALKRQFKKAITMEKTPGQLEYLNAIRCEPSLSKFEWKQIKFAVKNLIDTHKRQLKKFVTIK